MKKITPNVPEHFLKAFYARDRRYDGVFFIGVTSTGIYCRPVCRARKPKPENCVFFHTAAEAEMADFRPCLLCRPELAPGLPTVAPNFSSITPSDKSVGERQQRRNSKQAIGVTPKQWQRTQNLLLAKQLLTDTNISVTDVAFAAGFSSVRRFNDVFKQRYQLTPSGLRKTHAHASSHNDWLQLTVSYRPPYRWQELLAFLAKRQIYGVEHITEHSFARSLVLSKPDGTELAGEINVTHNEDKHQLQLAVSTGLFPAIATVLHQTKQVFDTQAQPHLIAENLITGKIPGDFNQHGLGLRVPGSFDGFELAVRAVLGQQITVKAAATLSRRFCDRFCQPYQGIQSQLTRLPVSPKTIAHASVDDIASLGIIARRAEAIISIAQQVCSGQLTLAPGASAETVIKQLQAVKGIGPWTANYIALRALAWPDAFPKEDIVLRKTLGGATAKQAEEYSQPWRPWRSYACLYLWKLSP